MLCERKIWWKVSHVNSCGNNYSMKANWHLIWNNEWSLTEHSLCQAYLDSLFWTMNYD